MIAANAKLRQQVDEIQDISFETADGRISFVDHGRNLVWINLGEADSLPIRTGFSVYTKANHGIGRRSMTDIKGKIEITRVIGAHLAEARILKEDIYRPMAEGDPIYSPLFNAGRSEKILHRGQNRPRQ